MSSVVNTMRRRVVIASSIEPSGADWLMRALRELGVLFRDDVEIDYVEDLPDKGANPSPSILFVRDPRDAIIEGYERAAPDLHFESFFAFPNPKTLLDRGAHWTLFARAWLARPGVGVFRFEDRLRAGEATLRAALDHVGLRYSRADIARAVLAIGANDPTDGEGRLVLEPRERAAARAKIATATRSVLGRLGYGRSVTTPSPPDGFGLVRLLGSDRAFALPDDLAEAAAALDPLDDPRVGEALRFARALGPGDFARAKMTAAQARATLDALAALSSAHDARLRERFLAMRSEFAAGRYLVTAALSGEPEGRTARG